jgi:excisionase family DNA binding protein
MAVDGTLTRLLAWEAMVKLDGEEYLTVDEAARLMGVKPATLYAYVSRGILRSYRQGIRRQRLYRRAEIEALTRVTPSAREERPLAVTNPDAAAGARKVPEIPLAESWIRD